MNGNLLLRVFQENSGVLGLLLSFYFRGQKFPESARGCLLGRSDVVDVWGLERRWPRESDLPGPFLIKNLPDDLAKKELKLTDASYESVGGEDIVARFLFCDPSLLAKSDWGQSCRNLAPIWYIIQDAFTRICRGCDSRTVESARLQYGYAGLATLDLFFAEPIEQQGRDKKNGRSRIFHATP